MLLYKAINKFNTFIFMKYSFLLLALLAGCISTNKEKMAQKDVVGTFERIEKFHSDYISSRTVDIWLPNEYDESEKYAVLYMHDGQMLFDSTTTWNGQEWGVDETLQRLIDEGKVRKTIVVGIWNGGETRHADYFPQKPFEALNESYRDSLIEEAKRYEESDLFATDVQSDNYLRFIVEELKPYIDSHFSTLTNRENTYVMGSSMGGLISMYAICEYPEVFAGAACLSTHWPGTFRVENNPIPEKFAEYMYRNLPRPSTHKVYFDYGTETLDQLYQNLQPMIDTVMAEKGFDSTSWVTRKFEGHDHSENSWKSRLHIPLTFLLGKD